MNSTGKEIEKIGNSVNLVIDFMKRNSELFRKKYTFEQLFLTDNSKRLLVSVWLDKVNLGMRVVNYKKKRVELYINNCKTIAIRFKMN